MKKSCFAIAFFLICFCVYGQQMPLSKIAPHRSAFFQERTGRAIVLNESLTYWLYQSSPDDMEELIGYLHSYTESIGYIINHDSFYDEFDNTELVTSVRRLMDRQKRNVSVTIWRNALVINIDADEKGSIANRRYYFMSWNLIGRNK